MLFLGAYQNFLLEVLNTSANIVSMLLLIWIAAKMK